MASNHRPGDDFVVFDNRDDTVDFATDIALNRVARWSGTSWALCGQIEACNLFVALLFDQS